MDKTYLLTHSLAGRRWNPSMHHLRKHAVMHHAHNISPTAAALMVGESMFHTSDRYMARIEEDLLNAEVRERLSEDPNLILEEYFPIHHSGMSVFDKHNHFERIHGASDTQVLGAAYTFTAKINGKDGNPVVGKVVGVVHRNGEPTALNAEIQPDGVVSIELGAGDSPILTLQVEPSHGFFGATLRAPENETEIELDPLPMDGPLAWWHQKLGFTDVSMHPWLGRGIRIGVIDSGVGPNSDVSHVVPVGSILNGEFDPSGGFDVMGHGTMVSGLIGGRPQLEKGYAGMAPAAEVFSIRVYPSANEPAQLGDIAQAIELLSTRYGCDLINMSLATPADSQLLQDAIIDAFEGGTLCIVAAGNQAGEVQAPASFPQTVAVTAVGKKDWAPAGSFADSMSDDSDEGLFDNDLFFADKFSNRGAEVTCTAPGVGIIAPVPNLEGKPYYAEDTGTSFSCPIITGMLAAKLSIDHVYLGLPRDLQRPLRILGLLEYGAKSFDEPAIDVGIGLPQLV